MLKLDGDTLVCVSAAAAEDASPLVEAAVVAGCTDVVGVVRAAFLPDGTPAPPLERVMRPLGNRVVAVAAHVLQQPHLARVVDVWQLDYEDKGSYVSYADGRVRPSARLQDSSQPLARFLKSRRVRVRVRAAAPPRRRREPLL